MLKRTARVASKQSRKSENMLVHNGLLRHRAIVASGELAENELARRRNVAGQNAQKSPGRVQRRRRNATGLSQPFVSSGERCRVVTLPAFGERKVAKQRRDRAVIALAPSDT